MSELDELLEEYIVGCRGEWYYLIELDEHVIQCGYFYRKADCRRHMRAALRRYLPDYNVACEFFRRRRADD